MSSSLQHGRSGVFSFLRHYVPSRLLRRLEDLSLPQEVHNTRAKTQFRRAVTRFRNSIYQPDMGEDGLLFARVRSTLADTLLCSSDSPPLRTLPFDNFSGHFLPAFLRRWITRIFWIGRSRIRHYSILTFRSTPHASCGNRTWLTIL